MTSAVANFIKRFESWTVITFRCWRCSIYYK